MASESAGPAYSVPCLVSALAEHGLNTSLHVLEPVNLRREWTFRTYTYPARSFPLRKLGRSPEMLAGLSGMADRNDIIHDHGLWMMPNIYAAVAARRTGARLVISPRGMMSEWSWNHSRLKKMVSGCLGQYRALKECAMWHATSREEYEDIRRLGYRQPVALIANGVDICERETNLLRKNQLLFLSRLHPKKGVDILLRCWSRLCREFPQWQLLIAGPDNHAYADSLKEMAGRLECTNCVFTGEVVGRAKDLLYDESAIFVLPTHSENFGLVIAEALAHGTPVITTTGTPWRSLPGHHCGECIELGEDTLTDALRNLMQATPEVRESMGRNGQELMRREYGWNGLGEKMMEAYAWLRIGSGTPPEWVIVD